jgi:hypothetical protein
MRRKKIMKRLFCLGCGLLISSLFTLAFPDRTEALVIGFDDPNSLSAIPDGARFTLVDGRPGYEEKGMRFIEGVEPPDPALHPVSHGNFGLNFENEGLYQTFVTNPLTITQAIRQPRRLATHIPGHVIQMTYDPNHDGVLDPFNLKSIDVLGGKLNVGVCFGTTLPCPASAIGVYNNLTAGFHWNLIDADSVIRVTLETIDIFVVDNIEFEPATPPSLPLILDKTSTSIDVPFLVELTPEFQKTLQILEAPEPPTLVLLITGLLSLLIVVIRRGRLSP